MILTPLVQLSIASGEVLKQNVRTTMIRKNKDKRRSSSMRRKQERTLPPNSYNIARKPKISFAPANKLERHYEPAAQHSDVTTEELWCTPYDFQRFNKIVHQEAKTVRLAEEDLLQGFDQSHAIAIHLAESVKKNADDEGLSRKVFNRLDMRHSGLARWCTSHDVRGLEKFASKQHRNSKHFVREELKKAVLWADVLDEDDLETLHQRDPARRLRPSNRIQRTEDDASERLAQISQGITRESRLFARMMGLADELAAKQAYSEGEEDR